MYTAVIPTLGRLAYLNELLETIQQQTLPPEEVIVLLDDNEHCRIIEKDILQIQGLEIHFCNDMNLAGKRNYGAKIAKNDKIVFSDDDDLWDSDRGLLVCEALNHSAACTHNYSKFGSLVGANLSKLGPDDLNIELSALWRGANVLGGGSSIAVRKSTVELMPFSEKFRYCEDFEWWSRLLIAGISVKYLGKSLVSYRTHDSNMTQSKREIVAFNFRISRQLFAKSLNILISSQMLFLKSVLKMLFAFLPFK